MGNGIKNKKPGHELKEGFLELEIGFPKPSGPRNRLFGGQPAAGCLAAFTAMARFDAM